MINLDHFKKDDWIKNWAGQWSPLSCSYWGERWTRDYLINGRIPWPITVFFFNDGKNSHFISQKDRNDFGRNLAKEFIENPNRSAEVIANFRKQTDRMLDFIDKHIDQEIDKDTYKKFWEIQDDYYKPHINVKFVTDYLPKEILDKILPDLASARVNAEPVFTRTEEFMNAVAKPLSQKTGYPVHLILSLSKDEFESELVPSLSELENRYTKGALIVENAEEKWMMDDDFKKLENLVFPNFSSKELKGAIAYPGKAKGKVKIILNPSKPNDFQQGDILVTGMTRPEYLSLMHKASAFVTDAGGILSHAAIVAREMKKPCIIGTKVATRVLKDGDMVEVDADKGIVRIIK